MSQVTPEHLARQAVVYIRQSTPDQVAHNLESKRRQYNLPERARQLGWSDVAVIDDDLGRSGGGVARPGFEKLPAATCEVRVGVVVSIEASRLARNGRDWHTLLEFCGLIGTLIADEDGVYDPRQPSDCPLLGMKGTMSEMEFSVLRQRSLEALKQKARRGELFMTVDVGYVRVRHNPPRRTRIGASARRSRSSSPSSPRCSRCVRCTSGSDTSAFRCPPSPMAKATWSSGSCRSATPSCTF
ncbi:MULTISPECIES: recombinase family protein [Bradyrhizobium]|uniref:recombinase family protein n=1 Tax=Bradyrhizobium centrosematis TaxID=1300039 RepID=UPI00286DEE0C|nr:recombinase family protein [Bradyrhizobium centrosematis]MCS3765655.1 DNA invertase Pin-like site-specific DNA recombinase [Bradyrhizobium centrosematis]MCS3777881.1 DNA invertase Pin-like site-specific DNA recombinase [Bradyrhizobium centrosematis]